MVKYLIFENDKLEYEEFFFFCRAILIDVGQSNTIAVDTQKKRSLVYVESSKLGNQLIKLIQIHTLVSRN